MIGGRESARPGADDEHPLAAAHGGGSNIQPRSSARSPRNRSTAWIEPRCRARRGCSRSRRGGSRPDRGSPGTDCRPRAPATPARAARLHVRQPAPGCSRRPGKPSCTAAADRRTPGAAPEPDRHANSHAPDPAAPPHPAARHSRRSPRCRPTAPSSPSPNHSARLARPGPGGAPGCVLAHEQLGAHPSQRQLVLGPHCTGMFAHLSRPKDAPLCLALPRCSAACSLARAVLRRLAKHDSEQAKTPLFTDGRPRSRTSRCGSGENCRRAFRPVFPGSRDPAAALSAAPSDVKVCRAAVHVPSGLWAMRSSRKTGSR